jgi:serine/threonine-protein kinase
MSPEQAEGRPVDGRSDIFSFGVVLYEVLTGRRPFTGESTLSTLSAILRDDAPRMSQSTPGVPGPLDEIVRRCLAKRPDERWQNMHQLRDALAACRTAPPAPASASPPQPKRFPTLAVVSAAAVLLVGGILWFTAANRRAVPQTAAPPVPVAVPAQAGVLTNDHVLSMLRAKVPPQVIMQQIRSSRTDFDLSVSAIISLTEAGASTDVIETMRDPKRPASVPLQPKTTAPPPAPAPAAAIPPAPPAGPPVSAAAVTVPDGLPFQIELAEDIPADAEPGRTLHFTASKELRIGGTIVVPLHAEVLGEIVDGAKKKLIGGTRLTFRLKTAAAAGGSLLNLRASPSGQNGRRQVERASGPKPPKGVAAVIGAGYLAYTDGEQTIQTPK